MPPRSGRESCTKPTVPADGRAVEPVWGMLHRLHRLNRLFDLAIVSADPRGATLLRHAHGALVIAGSAR
jgi:hypothetical protein